MKIGDRIRRAFFKQPEAAARIVEQRNEARERAQAARDRQPKGEVSTKTFPLGRGLIPPADLWGAYLRVSWVRACVNAIVRTATSRGWGFRGNPASCLRARDLISRPNPQDSGLDLMINVFEDMEIFGRGFWELVREDPEDPNSPVVAIYTLDPVRTKPDQDKKGKITGYTQKTSSGETIKFEPWEVVYFPLSTKGSEAQGIAPLQSLLIPISTDIHAQNYNLSFFKNDALPSGVISMEGAPSDVIKRNRAYLESEHQGTGNAHKHLLLEGNVKFQDWQKSPKEADFLELRRFTRDEIISVFGVPPAKIGIIETGNIGGGSGVEQDKTFKKDTVEPLQSQVEERVNRFFIQIALGLFDCEFFFLPIDLETEKEKAEVEKTKAETKKLEAETVQIYLDKEVITKDEARKLVVIPGEGNTEESKQLFVIESRGKDTETGYARAKESFESPKRKGISSEKAPDLRALVTIKGSPKPFRSENWVENSPRFRKMRKRIEDELDRWRKSAVSTVRSVGVPKSLTDISKTLTDDVLASVDANALTEIIAEEMALGFVAGAEAGLDESDLPADSFDPSTIELAAVAAIATSLADTAASSISEKIRFEIAAGIQAGEGVGEIAARVNGIWNSAVSHTYTAFGKEVTRTYSAKAWSQLVARTETLRMMNQGRWEALKANDVKFVNIQLTLGAEAECIALSEGGPYELSVAEGLLPVHPNCRCTLVAARPDVTPGEKDPQAVLEEFRAQ